MADDKMPNDALIIAAAAALIRDDGAILMQRRPDASQHGGLWEFPGGKREAGETLTGCLARELAEELGIAVDPALMVHIASALVPHRGGELLLILFTARAWQGEPEARDGAAIAWVAAHQLRALAMPPADVPLAAALMAQLAG
jgi:8-oxo-dGTP diphosphatase